MLTFDFPWALPLLAPSLWLLWRSRQTSTATYAVANLFLWIDPQTRQHARSNDTRRVPPWLAWLQAAVLAALALALAQPALNSRAPDAALVVDVSMSMMARADAAGATRLDLAKRAAKQWLAAQPARSVVQIFGAGEETMAAGPMRAGSAEALAAIDSLRASASPGDIVSAVDAAQRQTRGHIEVISDLRAPGAADAAGRIGWQSIGEPTDNVGITALHADDGRAIVEVTNFGQMDRDVTLSVAVEGSGAGAGAGAGHSASPWRQQFTVGARAARSFAIGADTPRARRVTADLHTADAGNALTADDHRVAEVRNHRPVVAISTGNPAVVAALAALPDIDLRTAGAARAQQSDVAVADERPVAGTPSLVFRHANGATVPAISRDEERGVRTVFVSVDLSHTAWTLTPAFPVFVADSIDWLLRRSSGAIGADEIRRGVESDTRNAAAPTIAETTPGVAAGHSRPMWLMFAVFACMGLGIELALRSSRRGWRAVAAALALSSLAGPAVPFGSAARTAAAAVDASVSVSGNARRNSDRIRLETDRAAAGDHLKVTTFGGADTNIASALRAATATLPASGDRRIALISDGQQTSGDAVAEAKRLGDAGVPIDVIPLDSRMPAFIERIDAPAAVRAGVAIPLRAVVKGTPNQLLQFALARNGVNIDHRRIALDSAGEAVVSAVDRVSSAGVADYRATLSDEQIGVTLSENGAAVTVSGRGRILVISDPQTRGVVTPLVGRVVDVAHVSAESAPSTRDALAGFSAIVLNDIPLPRLTTRQQEAIAAAVSRDGAGLLVLGGARSLDAADISGSPLSELLPVDFTNTPRPPASGSALALLVDISGSMAAASDGVTKISAARDAIARALSVVPKTDAIEVIGFAAQPRVLIGPDDSREANVVAETLETLVPSGSTALAPAVTDAVRWLKASSKERRRLLLVTDGKTSVADAESTRAAIAGQGVEVSVVTIGADAEREWLARLAEATGGRAYFPNRVTDLAREVAREAGRAITGREITEAFTVMKGAHPLAPSDPAPRLNGMIAGRLRERAAAAWKGPGDAPVLAAWPRGLGRVVTYAADLGGRWSAPLTQWPGNGAFWTRALEWLARESDPGALDTELVLSPEGPRLVVDFGDDPSAAASSDHIALPQVTASVAGPSGQDRRMALHAVTSTRFEGGLPFEEPGDYRATIVVTSATGGERRVTRGWYWAGDLETQSRGLNLTLLQEIARLSGGRVLPPVGAPVPSSATIFGGARQQRLVGAAPLLLCAALVLLSFDYIRRTPGVS